MTALGRSGGRRGGARNVELAATATAVVLASKLLFGRSFLRLPAAVIAAGLIGARRRARGARRTHGAGQGAAVEGAAIRESGVPAVDAASGGDGGGGAARMGGGEAEPARRPAAGGGDAAKRRRKRAASRARNRAQEEAKEGEAHAGGWHPEPEVVEVKSPAELEPGIASASPTPTFSNRVDRRGRARGGVRREAPARAAAADEREPAAADVSRTAGYLAPDVGAGVREGDLGAVPAPDEAAGGEAGRGEPPDERD